MNFTAGDLRYQVRDDSSRILDVFDNKEEAIQRAIETSLKFKGKTFFVFEKNCDTEMQVFKMQIELDFASFQDVNHVYAVLSKIFKDEHDEMKNWYKK